LYFGFHDNEPGPWLENFGLASELLSFGSSKQVNLELYRENDVIRFDHCCGCATGRVIGHRGLHTGMHEAVLLQVPGLHVQFRFAGPRAERYEANTEIRHERCCVEYPFQFFAWQFV
jgi:hypothetical protein